MVAIGARILVESERVGVEPRVGVVTAVDGALVRVHWDSDQESSFVPAAGSMTVIGGTPEAGPASP